jgi:hypothetical protein
MMYGMAYTHSVHLLHMACTVEGAMGSPTNTNALTSPSPTNKQSPTLITAEPWDVNSSTVVELLSPFCLHVRFMGCLVLSVFTTIMSMRKQSIHTL